MTLFDTLEHRSTEPMVEVDGLPEGWAESRLSDIAEMRLGKMLDAAKQRTGTRLPYLRNINVRWERFDLSDLLEMTFQGEELAEFELRRGDVLVCEGGEPGRCAVWDRDGSDIKFQKAIHRIRLRGGIDPRWLMYDLRRATLDHSLDEYFTGSTIKHLTGVSLKTYRLRLPPLAEQKRIATKVEALLAKVRTASDRLAKVPALLKRFRQSVLAAACSGRLTAEWRNTDGVAEPGGLPGAWTEVALGALLREPLRNGHSAKASTDGHGIRTLTLSSVTNGDFSEANTKLTVADPLKVRDLWLQPGDLFVERSNTPELVGTARLYRGRADFAIFPDLLIRVRLGDQVFDRYAEIVLQAERSRRYFQESAQGTAGSMPKIDQGVIEAALIPLPPLPEQQEIVRRVEALFALADAAERRAAAARARVGRITQAVLAKAFRGELVETEAALARREGRDYEPASVLLERIRKERGVATAPKKPSRSKGKRAPASA